LLWFLTGLAWAIGWRSGRGEGWRGGVITWALLAVGGVMLVSAISVAQYRRPAWLAAWEWLALPVVFVLVRQLVRTREGSAGLLTALLAAMVGLSGQAIYQTAVQLPADQAAKSTDSERFLVSLPWHYAHVETRDAVLQDRLEAIEASRPSATFSSPDG